MICPLCRYTQPQFYVKLDDTFSIFRCPQCDNAFTSPPPGQFDYRRTNHQAQFIYETVNDLPSDWKRSSQLQLKIIRRFLPRGASILEVGCGNGIFMAELVRMGFNAYGLEPSLSSSAAARKKHLNVITAAFPSQKLKQNFDMIIASHVLEHIEDVGHILTSIRHQLNPGGLLMLTQTTYQGLVPSIDKASWYAWVPEQHYYHFTPKGLTIISAKHNLLSHGLWYSSLIQPSLKNLLPRIFPRLGDQFHLVLQKRK